jgi:hypothetical protein
MKDNLRIVWNMVRVPRNLWMVMSILEIILMVNLRGMENIIGLMVAFSKDISKTG